MARDPLDAGTRTLPGLAKSARERQKELKERRRQAGLLQRTYWVTPEEELAIQALLDSDKMAAKRRRRRNENIVSEHKKEVRKRLSAGEKPSAIATWLKEQHGFEGTGATLNGILPYLR